MTSNPVGWFEIHVQDMLRAKAFYTSVFGFGFEDFSNADTEMWTFPMDHEAPGAGGALVKMAGSPSGENSVLIYFACEDCGVAAEKAASAGAKVAEGKTSIGEHGYFAHIIDTEGNKIGLHSMN